MNSFLSPGNLITMGGALLATIGLIAFFANATNLSVPTFFYGVPIFLIGLSLKTTEVPPAKRVIPAEKFSNIRKNGPLELSKLLSDVTRWRYGQSAHLESSLKALRLWDIDNPPQLIEIEELNIEGNYGMRLRFQINGVPFENWEAKQERLGRFFAKGLQAKLKTPSPQELDLLLIPKQNTDEQEETNANK